VWAGSEWMRLQSLSYVDFAPGAADQPALQAISQRLGPTICYEDAYAVEQLAALRDAMLLVNVSNDAWFGDSTAPHQHLQIARFRSLESGRWMMRATNNGVSTLIDPLGRVMARTRQFVSEVLSGEVVPHTGLTPYAIVRNWPVLALCALALGVGFWRQRARRRPHGCRPRLPRAIVRTRCRADAATGPEAAVGAGRRRRARAVRPASRASRAPSRAWTPAAPPARAADRRTGPAAAAGRQARRR